MKHIIFKVLLLTVLVGASESLSRYIDVSYYSYFIGYFAGILAMGICHTYDSLVKTKDTDKYKIK